MDEIEDWQVLEHYLEQLGADDGTGTHDPTPNPHVLHDTRRDDPIPTGCTKLTEKQQFKRMEKEIQTRWPEQQYHYSSTKEETENVTKHHAVHTTTELPKMQDQRRSFRRCQRGECCLVQYSFIPIFILLLYIKQKTHTTALDVV